jgi:hypothetical protein
MSAFTTIEMSQSDFTSMRALAITLSGVPFEHRFDHVVLP